MRNFMRLSTIDVLPLMLNIKQHSEMWQDDTFLRHYPQGPFGCVETIFLRFPKRLDLSALSEKEQARKLKLYKANKLPGWDQQESINYPAWHKLPEAQPIVHAIMATARGERLGRVMLNKLRPGGCIFPHRDTPAHTAYYRRYHVVLQSAPGVVFRAGDESVYMATGEVWWFDNREEHEVINNSDADRVHMIVDVHKDEA